MLPFESITSPWLDKHTPIIIVGGGASFAKERFQSLRGLGYIIAVKASMFAPPPLANVGFGVDLPRLREWQRFLPSLPFPVFWAVPEGAVLVDLPDNLHLLRRSRDNHISGDYSQLPCGGTSGFGALAYALMKLGPEPRGARIFLFGFDYGQIDGVWHSDASKYGMKRVQRVANWNSWAERFQPLADYAIKNGIEIINASPQSKIDAFKKMTVDEALGALAGDDIEATAS